MPRGGEYDDGPTVASDNAIESGENKIAGDPKGDSDVRLASPLLSLLALKPCFFSRDQFPPASTAPAKLHHFQKALVR